ncbi:MAG TPA: HD domain-containing phosphohydrolase [Pyrinomonadaceae bacterium]|jgi:HD-GYP domain-containing protein (c-di-GMP phosphodiesterase class II)
MPQKQNKINLIYFVIITLLLVGLVPIVLTGWFLSERSAKELRAVENRYQTQLVQEKARQIEIFAQRSANLVTGFASALELSNDLSILKSAQTEKKLGATLKENSNLLALYVKPVEAESLSVFRAESINKNEIEDLSKELLANITNQKIIFGQPQKIASSGELVLTAAAPVIINQNTAAAVVAVVSMKDISRGIVGTKAMTENELWESGLPIVFVVDDKGRTVFHPDADYVSQQKPLNDLRIVQEWLEANKQIQSALVPFSAEHNGNNHDMIGAYSTVSFGKNLHFGVITMQDEAKALASVSEMKLQTWIISLAFAFVALIIGYILSRKLTSPILKLAAAAKKIADGDFSTRVETQNITEIGTLGKAFNLMSDNVEEHIARLAKAAEENRELFVGTVKALAAAIDGKDRYTRGHSERVSRVSVAIGQRMGLSEDELETLRISALLHDVGKIAIDDAILKKPAALTNEEFEIMKTHPQKGYKILSQIPAMKDYLPGIHMHHEMVNGQGYPQALTDREIPLQAKIISVADTFDAMTIDRPYQKGMTLADALDRIKSFIGTRYDGKVVQALVEACNDGQIGVGVVRLRTNEQKAQQTQSIPQRIVA